MVVRLGSPEHTASTDWTWWKCVADLRKDIPELTGIAAWHIPRSWISNETAIPGCNATDFPNIIDAAECALGLALVNNAFMENTQIPLIVHQTARSADPSTWSKIIRKCVDRWLAAATGSDNAADPEMAWFMWDDDGIRAVVQKYEHNFYEAFSALPYPVEKAVAFRVLVLKWFGGIVSRSKDRLNFTRAWLTPYSTATSIHCR